MASVGLLAMGSGALAAEVQAAPDVGAVAADTAADKVPGQDIVVTGSRIARSTFDTPMPVTSLDEKQLQAKAPTSVVDLLRDMPALRPNRNNGSATDVGASTFNIRSLGATRTLVLIDGQRTMNSSPTGGFDLNLLPPALIKRLEIVTGGASSVYGSDAVTGVVNVFLDGKLKGGKADAQYGISGEGDARTFSASLAYGTGFAEDRGHIVAAVSYFNRPDILYQGARDWGSNGLTLIPNQSYTTSNGQFRQLIVPDVRLSSMTYGGVITSSGALKNIQFGVNGAQSQFVQGTNVSSIWMQGGEGLMLQPNFAVLTPSSKRYNGYARASYDFSPSLTGHVDVLFARSEQRQTNNYNYNNGDITIKADNAFLPANIRALMLANSMASFTLGRLNPELGLNDNTTKNTYIRTSSGLNGEIGGGWSWDANFNYTHAVYDNQSLHNRNNARWTQALDTVIGTNGQPICRSTLADPTNGCVPVNPFGVNTVSAQAVDWVTGTSWIRAYSNQVDVNLNIKGSPLSTWAGEVQTAFGAEYRRETVDLKSDPVSAINGWRQASSAPYQGAVNVKETYLEVGVPLAKDVPFARDLQLDLAGRYVDYSTSGGTGVWKVGLNWNVNDQIRFRGTYSRDFRAPTINELFAAATVRQGNGVIDRTTNQSVVVATLSGGNAALKPESAHTLTFGVVLRPDFLRGFQFSVDAFDINLTGAITALIAQEVIDRCFAGSAVFCAGVQRNSAGTITQVQVTTFNAQQLKTRGLDIEASYRTALGDGDLTLSTVATYVDRLTTISNGVVTDTAGQLTGTNATPKWRAATTVSYHQGPVLLRLLGNFVGGGKYDNSYGPLDLDKNSYAGRYYLDLSATIDITPKLQLFAKVENLTNVAPPLLAESTIVRAGAANASGFYDTIGRNFGVGIRARW
ncbi:TonB-dependent receptor plug domain-containing protein [Novosphingobium flavum]|nr:TonB-dependent receptor [Novosphingobium flavum]